MGEFIRFILEIGMVLAVFVIIIWVLFFTGVVCLKGCDHILKFVFGKK
jgi:hypothetical protein